MVTLHDIISDAGVQIRTPASKAKTKPAKKTRSKGGSERIAPTSAEVRLPIGTTSLMSDKRLIKKILLFLPNGYDYDSWIKLSVAIKAGLGGDEKYYDLFAKWCYKYGPENTPETVSALWDSITNASLGADFLLQEAIIQGFKFTDYDPSYTSDPALRRVIAKDAMFHRYVYCEQIIAFIDTKTNTVLSEKQLKMRENDVGCPSSATKNASNTYVCDSDRKRVVDSITYRPGHDKYYKEPSGKCYNMWQAPKLNLPEQVTDEHVSCWLKLVLHVLPDEYERNLILDWMAHALQKPNEKCNWAVFLGSTAQGIGKDLMMQPLIKGVGETNTQHISPTDLSSDYTDWAASASLVIIEEMASFDRKELMNKLKGYIAAPPDYIRINAKYVRQYDVPNVARYLFFSNVHNALSLERLDRRFFIYWSPAEPESTKFYTHIGEWYEAGGYEKVIRWLMQRDISSFKAKSRAPASRHKEEMRRAGLGPLEEWIEDAIEYFEPPFDKDIICIEDITRSFPARIEKLKPPNQHIGHIIKRCGGFSFGRIALGQKLDTTNKSRSYLYALRNTERYKNLPQEGLIDAFWQQREGDADSVDELW